MSALRKTDYIAKYGEDAWKIEAARRSEYQKQYRKANKEYFAEYNKQWQKEHPDKCKEKNVKWQKAHPEQHKQYQSQYQSQYQREYQKEHHKQYYRTQIGRANGLKNYYIHIDKKKGFPADQVVNEDWIIENIFNSSCIYCGESDWTHLGADRIDNTKGHTPDNCVCACGICNMARGDRFSVEEFKEYRRTHPRKLGGGVEKSWEIVEKNGVRVIKKKNVYLT